MTAQVVLFDLDGTLLDSAPAILGALRQAFADHGVAPLDPETERGLVGPPMYRSLGPLIGDDLVWPVIESYRAHYAGGRMYEVTVFPGVPEVLAALRRAGRRLAVATSKAEQFAAPIVERAGLGGFFETVAGDTLDASRPTKALVIGEALRRLGGADPAGTVMIGDREHDILGAREHGIAGVGVGWGYAAPGELARAGASPVCATAAELAAALGVDAGVAVR